MIDTTQIRNAFLKRLANPLASEVLFDQLENLTYFVKDDRGRYISVNQTLVERCGETEKAALIGRTSAEVFPDPLGEFFIRQDLEVVRTNRPLINELEQHPYPTHKTGWCLTTKMPLCDVGGEPIGLVGMSRDVQSPDQDPADFASVADVVQQIKRNLNQPLKTTDLAKSAKLSAWQLDQRMRELFGVTTAQLVLQSRMDIAAKRLRGSQESIVSIALAIGYSDQSAFSRQFRKTFGMPPGDYRRHR
ncbi:AraC family transcriptional regulator [Rhodopirellula sp. SWK7]|uniref:AraC family transcriptional regulator n=1 Tax=Rhodopirellula sp. SWK7 TaxID=595460 RepID=UPI0002BD53EB|nr:AraC family transcriptional regulator [Rhodopirellula sp. SWK7]EMI45780.1 transcriptional regulator, AraC family [Rhodopirellula sp. SWK7]